MNLFGAPPDLSGFSEALVAVAMRGRACCETRRMKGQCSWGDARSVFVALAKTCGDCCGGGAAG